MTILRTPSLMRVAIATVLLGLALVQLQAGRADAQLPLPLGMLELTVETLTTDTVDPTIVEVAEDGTVVFVERKGAVKVIDADGALSTAGTIGVSANQCADCPAEDFALEEGGLHGLLLYPDFAAGSGDLLLYYSVPGSLGAAPATPVHPDAGGVAADQGMFRLSRFTMDDGVLDLASEEILLENPTEWFYCCHYGGDIEWLADGTIVLSTGDDTNPHESSGYSPHDAGDGRHAFDAMRTSQNPADRRGKILRLDVDDLDGDGSIVPADNPFVDDPAYDPLVYAMGFRSNYRIDVDPESQAILVGNVGPDARWPDPARGPEGHDEVEVVPSGGGSNHGWPMCIGDNEPYTAYDFTAGASGEAYDCSAMTPAQIHYPYTPDPQFPGLAHGVTRTAIAGPVYRYDGDGPYALPDSYQGQFLMLEYSRNSLSTVPFDADTELLDTTQLVPSLVGTLTGPIDAMVGPDGAVYVANYGAGFYNATGGSIARIVPGGPLDGLPVDADAAAEAGAGADRTAPALLASGALLVLFAPSRRRELL